VLAERDHRISIDSRVCHVGPWGADPIVVGEMGVCTQVLRIGYSAVNGAILRTQMRYEQCVLDGSAREIERNREG
jgi:hypothetical protein